jgi:hypothetical protein
VSFHANNLGESLSEADTGCKNYVNDNVCFFFQFICDTFSISDYAALNGRLTENNWKIFGKKLSWPKRVLSCHLLGGTKNFQSG